MKKGGEITKKEHYNSDAKVKPVREEKKLRIFNRFCFFHHDFETSVLCRHDLTPLQWTIFETFFSNSFQ